MQRYRIYVRLKNGGQATGRELHTGPPPGPSTVVDVSLVTGRTVKARIGPFYTEAGTRRGTAAEADALEFKGRSSPSVFDFDQCR
jgi:hypothetical protein